LDVEIRIGGYLIKNQNQSNLKIKTRTKTRIAPLKNKPKLKPSSIFEIKRNQN
jgi:hypothetical protein